MGKLSDFCSEEERLANPFIKYDFFFKIGLALLSASPRALNSWKAEQGRGPQRVLGWGRTAQFYRKMSCWNETGFGFSIQELWLPGAFP